MFHVSCKHINPVVLNSSTGVPLLCTFWASFTKQGKLTRERYSKTALLSVEISAGDLLTMHKLNNTDATSNLHINQPNILSAAQISIVANKE